MIDDRPKSQGFRRVSSLLTELEFEVTNRHDLDPAAKGRGLRHLDQARSELMLAYGVTKPKE